MAPWICVSLLCFVFILFDCSQCINIDFDDINDGFFLKSPYHHKFKPAEPNIVKESLILTHPAEVYKLRASYGPFEMYQVVPNEILGSILKYGDLFDKFQSDMHRHVMHNMDVSAHLVSQTIKLSNPIVQVLVHAQTLARRLKQDVIYSYYGVSQRWCAQIFLSRGAEQHTSVCLLEGDTNACVASLVIPDHWWDPTNASFAGHDIKVFYDLSRVELNQECASVSNTIVPARAEAQAEHLEKKFISNIHLQLEEFKYDDHKDKDLIFRIPQTELQPNTKFEVPVYLDKNSALKEFVIQVKVRGHVLIEGAVPAKDSSWNVVFDSNDKDGTATVTVFQKPDIKFTKSYKMDEVMRWQFRVLSSASFPSSVKIVWNVDYEKNGLSRNAFFNPEGSRITAKFNVVSGKTDNVVIVLKERSLLNTAILTGVPVTYDMLVYSVSHNNTLRDVTKDSNCRSTDSEALQVSNSCDLVFLDGSETRGGKNVTILVRTADHVAQLGVRVWVPEPRLDIQLSDSKLSQIRGWKVHGPQPVSKRSVDLGLLTHSNVIIAGDKEQQTSQACRYKYQQSLVDVFARFTISTPGESTIYYRNKKTFVRVTKLVMDRLKVANPNIAKIVRNTVQGVSPGVTEVQVISPTGKLLGSKEVKVGKDKVGIERLMVRVISGMGIHIAEDQNLPGALLATVFLRDQLVAKKQEAVLDIAVEFKDGSMLPLTSVTPDEYELEVTSMNHDVVEVAVSPATAPTLPPSIKAVGNGKGEIVRVILRESETCSKRTARNLDTEYVHVQVDFAKDMDFYNLVQSDGFYFNRANERRPVKSDHEQHYNNKEEYFKHQQQLANKQQQEMEEEAELAKSGPKVKVFPLEEVSDLLETFTASDVDSENTQEPKSEALEQPVSTKAKHPSPLEIGMYVLVAVFVFAILVFTANCAVFMVRYQRKRSPKNSRVMTGSISQAPDWVWIGRATLERHGAGSAGCNHALMAEEDFNGNQMVVPNALPSDRQRQPRRPNSGELNVSNSTSGVTGSGSSVSESNRNSMVSTYKGSECSIRITSNPLPDNDCGMGYNEAEWDYEAMGMTYEQLMEYFDNLKESSA